MIENMTESMKAEYNKALEYWDNWLAAEEEIPEEFDENTSWKEIGSEALVEAAASMGECDYVLDYGCGSGWASVIMAKNGCNHIKAVDVAKNGIKASEKYASLFHELDKIEFEAVAPDWLLSENEQVYDGIFCSNVLDVIPRAVSEMVLQGIARVCKTGARVIIGLNPCFDKESLQKRNMIEIEKNHYTYEGVLRIVNLSDAEWAEILGKDFTVVECRHFRWDGEPETVNRRLFILEKR